jgi:hypothetical protein
VRDHKNQIESEGEVDHEEENESPIPPALDRDSVAGDTAAMQRHQRRRSGVRWERASRERGVIGCNILSFYQILE